MCEWHILSSILYVFLPPSVESRNEPQDTEAAEKLMNETAQRLDKVQDAWSRAKDKSQALGLHSGRLTAQLNNKAVALASAQATQELALRSAK